MFLLLTDAIAGYLLCYSYLTVVLDGNYSSIPEFWESEPLVRCVLAAAVLAPLLAASLAWLWSRDNWAHHPMVASLRRY